MPTQKTNLAVQAAVASLLVLAGACHKRPSGPSAHYDKGAAIHQDLYVHELDDAYLDPKMDEAVAELKQVPADSVSAHLAQDLLATIEKGRKDAQAAKDARAKGLAASQQPQTLDPSRILLADAAPLRPGSSPDGGPAVLDPYGPGAPIADINKETGGCLVSGTEFREDGSGKSGTTYKLADDPACKSKLPGFVNQTVLAVDGRIYRRVANSEVKTEKVLPGSPRFLPDGGVAPSTPAANALGGPTAATAAQPSNATSTTTNVAAQQNATPPPAPAPGVPRAATSDAASTTTNVAAQQNATPPPAPMPTVQPAQVPDATPPPPQ